MGLTALAVQLVPSVWVPLRRWSRLMRCPSCRHLTWCRLRLAGLTLLFRNQAFRVARMVAEVVGSVWTSSHISAPDCEIQASMAVASNPPGRVSW